MRYVKIQAAKRLMYHGTSSKYIRSILKNGLVYKKDHSNYENDLKSFPGVYFAFNFGTAMSCAGTAARKTKANPLYVVANIETQTALLDEDNIRIEMFISLTPRQLYQQIESWGLEKTLDYNKPKILNMLEKLLERRYALTKQQKDNFIFRIEKYLMLALKYYYIIYIFKSSPEFYKSELEKLSAKYNKEEYSTYYLKAYTEFLNKTKTLVRSYKEEWEFSTNVRVTEPVTYSGANRILVVVEEFYKDKSLKVWYNKSPAAFDIFMQDFNKFVGNFKVL